MADNDGSIQGAPWPLPKFYFSVEVAGIGTMGFQAVEGLSAEVSLIEYRHSNSPEFSKIKMPGMKTYTNVTLKKGVFVGDSDFFDWFNSINMNTVQRKTVIIKLLDETGDPAMTWTLRNAFPVKYEPSELNSQEDGEPALESIEIAHEGFTLVKK